jgi:glycosyltransferase involved in cell wall biosynthesis
MKILYLNNFCYLRGGAEKVLFEECRIFRKAGNQVAIFSRSNDKNDQSEFNEFFPPRIDTDQIRLKLSSIRSFKELIYSKESRAGLREVIKRFNPDIAHAHNIYGRLSVSVLDELQEARIPVVMTLHDFKLICPSYLMLSRGRVCEECKGHKYYRAVRNRCHKGSLMASAIYALETLINHALDKYGPVSYFISPSRFLKEKFVEFGWDPERIAYIPNFVVFEDKDQPTVPGEYLLYLGRLSMEKGVRTLLEACKGLEGKVKLKIVGDGPERRELQKIASAHALPVEFTGFLGGEMLRDAVAQARAIVMPSEWYENAPLSLLESFANAKPVIGARIGGIPEMIDEGINGFLFEPGNVEGLTDRIKTISALPDRKIVEMGRAAREKVEKAFTPERHFEQLMSLYRRALGTQCA